jgi:ABC-type amino acid transport substrate-binding protein
MQKPFRRKAVLAACACLALVSPLGADFAEIKARGVVRVLCGEEDPVWFSIQGGPAPGFEREVLEGFARLHKLRFEAVVVTRWEDAIPELLKGRGDLIAGMNDTEARRQRISFTSELLPSRHVVVTRAPYKVIRTPEELRAERVGVIPETTWAEAVAAAGVPADRVEKVTSVAAGLEGLRRGRFTATVLDISDFLLQRRTDSSLQDGLVLGAAVSSAWGVRKTDPELRRELNQYLQNLKQGAGWSRLVVHYFGPDALRMLGRAGPQ